MEIEYLTIGQLYQTRRSTATWGSEPGGIRLSIRDKEVVRAVIMTSDPSLHRAWENPYHDRLEGRVLTYTAAGKFGQQALQA